ncbi:hypothetical protein MP228_002741 [Amoeboaphelidium protococcarum]|nr:hypothetical protein MP228_002741 [Amoeboaphelidium protococcarum]
MTQNQFLLPVEPWIKFTSTTVGRDKLYRTVQYFSKFLAFYLSKSDSSKDLADRLTRLSAAVGLARKLFRFGKPADFIQTIFKSLSIKDDVIKTCAIGRSLFLAMWLGLDTLQWLNAHKVINLPAAPATIQAISAVSGGPLTNKTSAYAASSNDPNPLNSSLQLFSLPWVNKNAARCWFIGLLFAISADLWRLRGNIQRVEVLERAKKGGTDVDDIRKELSTLKREQKKIYLELAQDTLDLVIPGSLLEIIKVDNGFVGLVGTITSLIGWNAAWPRN